MRRGGREGERERGGLTEGVVGLGAGAGDGAGHVGRAAAGRWGHCRRQAGGGSKGGGPGRPGNCCTLPLVKGDGMPVPTISPQTRASGTIRGWAGSASAELGGGVVVGVASVGNLRVAAGEGVCAGRQNSVGALP
jgi:hypothetical protein